MRTRIERGCRLYVNVEAGPARKDNELTVERSGAERCACAPFRYPRGDDLWRGDSSAPIHDRPRSGERKRDDETEPNGTERDGAWLTGAPPCSRVYFSTSIPPIRYRLFCKHCAALRGPFDYCNRPLLSSRPFSFALPVPLDPDCPPSPDPTFSSDPSLLLSVSLIRPLSHSHSHLIFRPSLRPVFTFPSSPCSRSLRPVLPRSGPDRTDLFTCARRQ